MSDRSEQVNPEETDFGRLNQEASSIEPMPAGQPTHYSLVQIGTQKVLVRHTADGFRKDKGNVLTKIVPKLEYQIHYGGEMMGRFC